MKPFTKLATAVAVMFGLVSLSGPAQAADSTVCSSGADFTTIQDAIDDDDTGDGDTITVCAETFEPFTLNKRLYIKGAQAGVSACDRSGSESVITDSTGNLIELQSGSAGSVIDGFHLSGGTNGIVSTTGPIDNLQILNNLIGSFTASGVFLNDNGDDITAARNRIDGSSQTGNGALFHLDQDIFDGFHFIDNCVVDGVNGVGFFVDGSRNVGVSATRAPLFSGNLIDGMEANSGVNIGRLAIEFATFTRNTFSNNEFDGLQGGPKGSLLDQNTFSNNGRAGLRFTGFGGTGDSARGAQSNTVTKNCFIDNGLGQTGGGGIRLDDQFPGTQATNTFRNNNIFDNTPGALNNSADDVTAEDNWWGAANGPSGDGSGSGDAVIGMAGGGSVDFDPFLTAEQPNTPCSTPPLTLDHFQCYDAWPKPKYGHVQVSLEDQFGLVNGVRVKWARKLCAPVSKNGEPISNPDAHLVCYQVKNAAKLKFLRVAITNQFGEEVLWLNKARTLCVPSTKEVLPPHGR